jgi:hypothetical protein
MIRYSVWKRGERIIRSNTKDKKERKKERKKATLT